MAKLIYKTWKIEGGVSKSSEVSKQNINFKLKFPRTFSKDDVYNAVFALFENRRKSEEIKTIKISIEEVIE